MKNRTQLEVSAADAAETADMSAPEQSKDKAYEKVVLYVKEKIRNGEIKVGDKLPTERELSEKLELSRNSVREALRTMDNMGLISCRQGSGNYLTGDLQRIIEESMCMMFMLKQIDDLAVSQLRRALDKQAIILAISNFTKDNMEEIEEMIERLKECEANRAVFLDKEIHMLISKYADNKLMEIINDSLSRTMEKFISMARECVIANEGDVLSELHKDMLMSIVEGNVERGVFAVNRHYDVIDKYISKK